MVANFITLEPWHKQLDSSILLSDISKIVSIEFKLWVDLNNGPRRAAHVNLIKLGYGKSLKSGSGSFGRVMASSTIDLMVRSAKIS